MSETDEVKQAAPGVYICKDGKLRWEYDYNAWADPAVFLKLVGVLLCLTVIGAAVAFFLTMKSGVQQAGTLALQVLGYAALASIVLAFIGWASSASSKGGKYCVVFEMDDKGVNHIDMQGRCKKSDVTAMINATETGEAEPTAAAAGILAASKKSLYSEFKKVRRLTVQRPRRTLKVDSRNVHNEVYAGREQFDFVLDYIRAHCKPDVKVK